MSELENIKPVAFYRADWKGDMMFRKDNTVVIRKNEGDFTTGWIKPLYDELPEPQPQLTIPKSIADEIEEKALDDYGVFQTLAQKKHIISDPEPFCDLSDEFISWCENNEKWWAIMNAYLAGKALGVDLVKVGEG